MQIIRQRRLLLLLSSLAAGAVGLAACGGDTSRAGTGGGAAAGAGTTVSARSTAQGNLLTDARGRTLYVSDQENGTVLCTSGACTSIWMPLTVGAGVTPTASGGVSGSLSTVRRPDGSRQVTVNGRPLYTFAFDSAPGQTGGDGQRDSFGGTAFTWHTAVSSGPARTVPSAPPSTGYDY